MSGKSEDEPEDPEESEDPDDLESETDPDITALFPVTVKDSS